MKKFYKFLIPFSFFSMSVMAQNTIKELIDERNNDFSRINNVKFDISMDSVPALVKNYVEMLESITEKDNKLIDMIEEEGKQFSTDTTYINSIKRNAEVIQTNYDSLEEKQFLLLIGIGASVLLFLFFFILFFVKSQKAKTLKKNYLIQQQLTDQYRSDSERLQHELKTFEAQAKEEYQHLKEAFDKQLQNHLEREKDFESQINQLKHMPDVNSTTPSRLEITDNITNQVKQTNINSIENKMEKLEINVAKLEKLKQLFDSGLIDEAEFKAQKASLLDEMNNI